MVQARALIEAGASIIDIGAESTNPKSQPLSPVEEWHRLSTILPTLINNYPGQISLDTYHVEVAERALEIGDVIINDVSGLADPKMHALVLKTNARVIISHSPTPIPTEAHAYAIDDINEVKNALLKTASSLEKDGLPHSHITLDPGIGFGKTMRLNKELLAFASITPHYDVMIGYSRKRFLGEMRMESAVNIAAGKIAAHSGAKYLRVHDVWAHKELLDM